MLKKIFFVSLCLCVFLCAGCSRTVEFTQETSGDKGEKTQPENTITNTTTEEAENMLIKIVMQDGQEMEFELYPSKAPETVANFVALAEEGFYDGLTFHRIVEGFMIQGGDPEGTGMGGSDKTIRGEFLANGFEKNDISHERGVISMARATNPNSASSQFFICHADAKFLDGQYAAFGKMTKGYETLDALAKTPVRGETPVTKPVISKITVE